MSAVIRSGARLLPRGRRWVAVLAAAALVAVAIGAWKGVASRATYVATARFLVVRTGPSGSVPVRLDTTYYRPNGATAQHPVPAVLLAHGFGETKQSVAGDAEQLAEQGYAVLTWTAQGFGRSGGQIHLDHPEWEVRDASQLIDWLSARPEVLRDRPGDPRVGVVGGSYGGALALLLAGYDHRVDAIVPQITWNNLASAFFPNAATSGAEQGVFQKGWAGQLFGSGSGAGSGGRSSAANPSCGRFAPALCQLYLEVATTGSLTPPERALLEQSSPSSILGRIRAPTLLIQGETDTLFPLSQADANERGIVRTGTPVRVAWYTGGHGGGNGTTVDQDWIHAQTLQWLNHYLRGEPPNPGHGFTFSHLSGYDEAGDPTSIAETAASYPALSGQTSRQVAIAGPPQPIANPPGGTPAATSSVPGVGSSAAAMNGAEAHDIPGQHADFVSAPVRSEISIVGTPSVRLRVASPTGEAVLFVKLYDLNPHLGPTLPGGLVAPVRLTGLPRSIAQAQPVLIQLPGIVRDVPTGDRFVLTVATSDEAFASPPQPTLYVVAAQGALTLPSVTGTPLPTADWFWPWVLLAVAMLLLLLVASAIVAGRWHRRRGDERVRAETSATPLIVEGLRKAYPNRVLAVDAVTFRVEREQVVGLLGPNGAGKTTSLRVLLGLLAPTGGTVYLFGHRLRPGAPVLSRLGALVEGPGFMPHLSGAANLRRYWQATGRPAADARLEEALAIAGLGAAAGRRVGTYSHGMKQRLAIAQAMLGLPDLLVLDEPTDGLDPPQIAEMRRVLQRYAAQGRAVLVSSHLLAEVEQTCTHAVVMHHGRVVASGAVQDLVGEGSTVLLDVSDRDTATAVLQQAGISRVSPEGTRTLAVDLDGVPRGEIVRELVRAGIDVERIAPRRRLEDAFLDLVGGAQRSAPAPSGSSSPQSDEPTEARRS